MKGEVVKNPNKKKDTAWILKTLFLMSVAGILLFSAVVGGVLWHFSRDLPKIISVADYKPATVTQLIGTPDPANPKANMLIGELHGNERRYVIPYEKIPELLVRAFISAEDDKFFEHGGVNFSSMIRAGLANFRAGHLTQGGSTITQQVCKSLLLTSERTFSRKIKELILANRIEQNLTKQQILFLYLNQIYLGHGAYGVQAAAQTYYRKDVSLLSIAEAAVLAGMPQAPGKYSPIVNPKKAKERQLYVLRRMYENKYITQAQLTEAAAQPLKIFNDEEINNKYAPYLVEHVRRYLIEKYGEKAVYEDGLTVILPTEPKLAQFAGKSLREGLRVVDKRMGYRGPIQHLGQAAEVEKFLKEERIKLINRKLGFQMMMPDGRLDSIEALRVAGIQSDAELVESGELYRAVVTSLDDKRKLTGLMIGAAHAELPLDKMKWARPIKDEKALVPARGEPTAPSRVFQKGDVILVRIADDLKATKDTLMVQLEQEPQIQGALVSLEAQTGYVLAMEGGYDYESSEFNRATQAQRQPGSAFKPIIYAAGLEKGYTPASIIVDSPIVYGDTENGKWKPSNFEEKFYGDTTFRQALIKSRNVPTIKIAQAISVSTILEYAKRLGIDGKIPADLSISLGSASVSLLELTKVYSLFPRLGRKVVPIFLTKVIDRDGKVLEEQKPKVILIDVASAAVPSGAPTPTASPLPISGKLVLPEYPLPNDPDQVLDPRVAFVMTHLMKEVVNYGTGHDAKALNRQVAGKTGTTSDCIDAWFMGFTPHVVTGVWVGFDSQKTIGHNETGARAALPIWLSFMREVVKRYPDVDFVIPPGVVFASVDSTSGKLVSSNSSQAIREAFIEGTQPTEASVSTGSPAESQSEFFKEDVE
ncbi:PBP1A family penicillin-binding protein [Bdellovibrionota bacterium FG-1]